MKDYKLCLFRCYQANRHSLITTIVFTIATTYEAHIGQAYLLIIDIEVSIPITILRTIHTKLLLLSSPDKTVIFFFWCEDKNFSPKVG